MAEVSPELQEAKPVKWVKVAYCPSCGRPVANINYHLKQCPCGQVLNIPKDEEMSAEELYDG